jgi:hypothetical protein
MGVNLRARQILDKMMKSKRENPLKQFFSDEKIVHPLCKGEYFVSTFLPL